MEETSEYSVGPVAFNIPIMSADHEETNRSSNYPREANKQAL